MNNSNTKVKRVLHVKNFSCISDAELVLGQITVLIGPQASGKSVLSKLVYFFNNLLSEQFVALEEGRNVDEYRELIKERFKEWFPVSAWGNNKFLIEFISGDFQVRLTRIEYRGELGENMRVWISGFIDEQYRSAFRSVTEAFKNINKSDYSSKFDIVLSLRQSIEKQYKAHLGESFLQTQLFIPAGRSFFTNIGKAILAFEQGTTLDPLTVRFGRIYSSYKEFYARLARRRNALDFDHDAMREIFGGKVVIERGKEYLDAYDGRRIPFSALSSGQQELLPMWLVLEQWSTIRDAKSLLYIEEPEAHLFPSAQSKIVQLLAHMINRSNNNLDILITTHSPYVLAKINNLIKAGELGRSNDSLRDKVSRVIPEVSWVSPGETRAYAIEGDKLVSIIDEYGLIDASYLDKVSGEIAREFSNLLSIELVI